MKLDGIKNISKLDAFTQRPDIRRDLHVFCDYVQQRDVKRAHRDNSLTKGDAKRLVKLMSDPDAKGEVAEQGNSSWLDYVDDLALRLRLVEYDTDGTYASYTSHEPSFPDNYIHFDAKAYRKMTSESLAQQETRVLECLVNHSFHEFFSSGILGRLDCFSIQGSAIGVVPTLDFPSIRRFLLDLLGRCPTGDWLSTASLVEYLKTNHRYFLIPKKLKFERQSRFDRRYSNFHESKDRWGYEIEISESDEDAFERVEGRYVERFLESIPNLLGYVDVAYARKLPKSIYPSRGHLKAFRVSERLQRALAGEIAEPTLRVTPNFEVYLQAEIYPARQMTDLSRFCELVTEDTTTVFRLDKQLVAAAQANDSKLDVVGFLTSLSTEPLPTNVQRELADWAGHSEKFVLFSGCSLLETDRQVSIPDRNCVETISPGTHIVRSPAKLFAELEKQQLAPLRIKHGEKSFSPLPPKTRSAFARKAAAKKQREPKTRVTLMRTTRVQLLCPDREFLNKLQQILANANCPIEADRKNLSLAYSDRYETEVKEAIRTLKKEYEVKINDQ